MLTHLKELYRFRDLLISLAMRDIKVRYRQTLLGVAWAVIQPLAFMAIFTLVFARFGKMPTDGAPYPIFSYTGLVPWTFFATGIGLAVQSVSTNMNVVKKIYFPREVFPMGAIIGCFIDFLVAGSLIIGLLVIYRIPVSWHLLWVPWLVAIEVGLLIGLGLLVSAMNVFYRDVKYIVPLLVQLGLFVTPVIYSTSKVPEHLRGWYMLNPMAVVIDGIRQVLLHQQAPRLDYVLIATGFVGVLGFAAYAYFKRAETKFADLI